MSTLDVVADILREVAPRALKARQIAALAGSRLPTASRTPETVVSRDLAIDVKDRGVASRFLRVERGAFVLKEALPTAFYSDNDVYASQWTRNLIAAGEIAAGVVDERSIRDLKPADVASYRQCHFFSGVAVWSRALGEAGWADDRPIWSGSPPCQPWSSAGKRGGEADDRHLWPEWFRLIRACGPPVVVGEQVASKDGYRWLDEVAKDFESAGYHFTATELSAAAVGAPHRRQRIYFVAVLGQRLVVSSPARGGAEAKASGSGIHALQARVEDEADSAGALGDHALVDFETERGSDVVAYARERGRAVVGASRIHDRGQRGDDAARRCSAHGGDADVLPNATGARPFLPEDPGADRGDAREGAEARDWRPAGDLESERGGAPDAAGSVPDAERVVWNAGRPCGPHGWPAIEPDGHGEADGAGRDDHGSIGLGDAGLARGGRNAGEVSRAQGTGEGEWQQARDLTDEPVSPGADDRRGVEHEEVVRGAARAAGDESGFKPGDRIRIDGDPSWGGAVRGFWAQNVEWIYCRPEPGHQDGRWRPAQRGIEPLATGSSPELGRTRAARLRGFGNSIVLPLATAFVEAVIDTLADTARAVCDAAIEEASLLVVEAHPPAEGDAA